METMTKNYDELIQQIDSTHDYTIAQASKLTGFSYTAIVHRVKIGNLPHRIIMDRKFIKGSDLIKAMTGFSPKVK
ncbi:MAG: hypothetical protein EOM23_08875 [Candidatus Moranbacteria bacterium]|nr:hypothetical protein [Candidatus Moranbacteria bacterium]